MKIPGMLCVVLTTLLFGSLALAGTFTENFDSGQAKDWKVIKGKWEVESGAYVETAGTEYAVTVFGDVNWTDYTVEVDVTLLKAVGFNCAGLLVRADEKGENGFRFWIRTDMAPQLSKWVNNTYEHIKIDIPTKIEVGKTYRLKAVLNGNKHQYFIGKDMVADYDDKAFFRKNGRIGFITYQANPAFDNLVISGPGIPSSPVEPKSKLATCWGGVKSLY